MPSPVTVISTLTDPLGMELFIDGNFPTDDAEDPNLAIYVFKKEGSALSAGEISGCQNFIEGTANKPAGIRIFRWVWNDSYEKNDQTIIHRKYGRYGLSNNPGNTIIRFADPFVKAAKMFTKEKRAANSTTSVLTNFPIDSVIGVYLAEDEDCIGINYATGGSAVGQVITLGTALDNPTDEVRVEYIAAPADGVEYHYTIAVYDPDDDPKWADTTSTSGYVEYTANAMTEDVENWAEEGVRKIFRNYLIDDETQIKVTREVPKLENITHCFVYTGSSSTATRMWNDYIRMAGNLKDHGITRLEAIHVDWTVKGDQQLRNKLGIIMKNSERALRLHMARMQGMWGGKTIVFEHKEHGEAPYNDETYFVGGLTMMVPILTISQEDSIRLKPSTLTVQIDSY